MKVLLKSPLPPLLHKNKKKVFSTSIVEHGSNPNHIFMQFSATKNIL